MFSSGQPIFGGKNAAFKQPAKAEEEKGAEEQEEDEDAKFGKGDGSPPAFVSSDQQSFGEASKPVKLSIQSRPPEKSPYEKLFHVSI